MKRCSSCRDNKPFSDFHKNKAQIDGHANQCKQCWHKSMRKYRTSPTGKATLKQYRQKPNYKASQRKYERSEKGKKKKKENYLRIKDTPEEKERNRTKSIERRKKYGKELRAKERETSRQKWLKIKNDPEALEKHREIAKGNSKKSRLRHLEKERARMNLRYRIRTGEMPHPTTVQCTNCDDIAKQYHHHLGYAKKHQLNVIPLCLECHKKEHWLD